MRLVQLSRRVIPLGVALASTLFLIAAVGALWLLLFPPETTFNVVAETERVVMHADHQVPWRWTFERAILRQGENEEPLSGSLQLGYPVEVAVERVGYGTLWIAVRHVTGKDDQCEAATRFGIDEEVAGRTSCQFDILVPDIPARAAQGQTMVLALEGEISAGRPLGFQTQGTGTALLRSGRVTLREETFILGTPYDAGASDLEAGDFFQVGWVNRNIRARGFIVVDERPAMTTAFRIVGKDATIERPGGGAAPLRSGIFSRFANDLVFRVLVALIAAIIGVITLSAAIVEGLDGRHQPTIEPATEKQASG